MQQPDAPKFDGLHFNELIFRAFSCFERDLDDWGFVINVPVPSSVKAGGKFGDASLVFPISRRPDGAQEDTMQAAGLDFAWAQAGVIKESTLSWCRAPADHAFLRVAVQCPIDRPKWEATTWRCADNSDFVRSIINNAPDTFNTLESFISFVNCFMDDFVDKRSRQQRRHQREPSQIGLLFKRAAQAKSDHERVHLLAQARGFLKLHRQRALRNPVREAHPRGNALPKRSALKSVKAVILTEASGTAVAGTRTFDRALWKVEVCSCFGAKWGCNNLHKRDILLQRLLLFSHVQTSFCAVDVLSAFDCIKDSNKLDSNGLTMCALRLVSHARPDLLADAVNSLLSDRSLLEQQFVDGVLKGKYSATTKASDMRAILPFPCLLQLGDVLVASRLRKLIDLAFPPVKGIFTLAAARTHSHLTSLTVSAWSLRSPLTTSPRPPLLTSMWRRTMTSTALSSSSLGCWTILSPWMWQLLPSVCTRSHQCASSVDRTASFLQVARVERLLAPDPQMSLHAFQFNSPSSMRFRPCAILGIRATISFYLP